MPKYITIGYGDRAGYERTAASVREAAHAHDARLRKSGAVIGIAGTPIHVRNPDASGTQISPGAYMRADLPVAGFALIDAANLNEAIQMASTTPCAVARGVVEIWPLTETPEVAMCSHPSTSSG